MTIEKIKTSNVCTSSFLGCGEAKGRLKDGISKRTFLESDSVASRSVANLKPISQVEALDMEMGLFQRQTKGVSSHLCNLLGVVPVKNYLSSCCSPMGPRKQTPLAPRAG